MTMTDPLGDMLTRIRNAQMRKKSKVSTPASQPAPARPRRAAGGGLYPRLFDGRFRQRPLGVRDRAEILRRRAGDPRDRARLEAGPARLCLGEEHPARRQRPRRLDPVDAEGRHVGRAKRATRTSAAKCSAASSEAARRIETNGMDLMSRIGKKAVPVPKGVTAIGRRPDGQRQGAEGRARRSSRRDDVAVDDGRRRDRGRAARRDQAGALGLGHVAHDGRRT